MMNRLLKLIGSIFIAVPVLITIAVVLAWGTIYETRFGTAAVQRFIYAAWWFQAILGFLAVNLATAAWSRYPWKRAHAPFLLAHLGIILILTGGIIGGRLGIDGQLIIPEGSASGTLQLSTNVLTVQEPNPGIEHVIPTRFETQAWVHEPRLSLPVRLEGGRSVQLTVNKYYPDAVVNEIVNGGGTEENPAIQVTLRHAEHEETVWLLARDPERFGVGWGEAHVLFLEPQTNAQREQLLGDEFEGAAPRGALSVKLPGMRHAEEMPVPEVLDQPIPVGETAYRIIFKDYFPDFAMSPHGVGTQSSQPNNPAVSFVLEGPEGADPYLLFALHPDFQAMHGFHHRIEADVAYHHGGVGALPPNTVAFILMPHRRLALVFTDAQGQHRRIDDPMIKTPYAHPSLNYQVQLDAWHPMARMAQEVSNRGDAVRAEAVQVTLKEGDQSAQAWVMLRGLAELRLGDAHPVRVGYGPAQRELPFTVKLLDFRKIDYPGTQMAAGFEADVELSDPRRGLVLMRKISMNNPLRYRGYSLFQASFIPGTPETTVLAVRNDPGTPLVYTGFLIVIGGVVGLFMRPRGKAKSRKRS